MGTPSFRSLCRIAPRERGSRPWPGAPGRVPPAPPACGPTPCPPCAAAVPPPARPACGSPGNVAAKAGQARPGQVGRLRCSGAPFRAARPSTFGARYARPCPAPPPRRLRRRCSGAARPPRCGGCGAVRASGPCGGASASLASPATPAAQAVPRGSACALAARRSGPSGLVLRGSARSHQAAPRALAPLRAASSLRGLRRLFGSRRARAAVYTAARTGGASAAFPRFARGGAQGTPPAGGMPPGLPAGKAKASAVQAGPARPRSAALPAGVPGGVGNRGGCPGLCRFPARSSFCLWGCSSCLCRFPLILPVLLRLFSARFPLALVPLLAALPWLAGPVAPLVSGGLWWLLLAPLAFRSGGLLPVLPGRCLRLLPLRLRLVPLPSGAAWAGPVVLPLAVSVLCGVCRSVSLFLCGLAFKPAFFSGKRKPPAR